MAYQNNITKQVRMIYMFVHLPIFKVKFNSLLGTFSLLLVYINDNRLCFRIN